MNIAILIPSCDNYADIWPLLAQSYQKFWPQCPYPIYCITNGTQEAPQPFISLNVGPDTDWSTNCITALDRIDAEYILMHIDDLIFTSAPRQDAIDRYVGEFIAKQGNYLKLLNITKTRNTAHIIPTPKEAPYRTSTVFSVWKKSTLRDILIAGESPWQFEVDGTTRSQRYDGWYSAPLDCFICVNLVIKRVIERRSLKKLEKIGIPYTGKRAKMSCIKNMQYILKCWIFEIILRMPKGLSKKLVELARKIG